MAAHQAVPAGHALRLLAGEFAVARLDPGAVVPAWASLDDRALGPLHAVMRTGTELSVVCPAARVPADVRAERGWRALVVAGPLDFALTGVLASIATPLADAGVSIFAVSSYDTDHVLVRAAQVARAVEALRDAGHRVTD